MRVCGPAPVQQAVRRGTAATRLTFEISVNPGEPEKPLSKVASGGELSRIMLALKNVLTAGEDVGMLIFDEIDTGVSGHAAQQIGRKLSRDCEKEADAVRYPSAADRCDGRPSPAHFQIQCATAAATPMSARWTEHTA